MSQDAAGTRDPGADESLSEAFRSVARRLRETTHEALAPWDITPSAFRALRMLERHGAMRLSELSEQLRIAPRSVTEVADTLESRGLAERRPDPADRRATLIGLTGHGSCVLDAIRAARGTEAERVLSGDMPGALKIMALSCRVLGLGQHRRMAGKRTE